MPTFSQFYRVSQEYKLKFAALNQRHIVSKSQSPPLHLLAVLVIPKKFYLTYTPSPPFKCYNQQPWLAQPIRFAYCQWSHQGLSWAAYFLPQASDWTQQPPYSTPGENSFLS